MMLLRRLPRIGSHGPPIVSHWRSARGLRYSTSPTQKRLTNAAAATREPPSDVPIVEEWPNPRIPGEPPLVDTNDESHTLRNDASEASWAEAPRESLHPLLRTKIRESLQDELHALDFRIRPSDDLFSRRIGSETEAKKTDAVPEVEKPPEPDTPPLEPFTVATPTAILMSILDSRMRPLSDAEFHRVARFLTSRQRLSLPVVVSKLLLTRDERFQTSREDILAQAAHRFCPEEIERWEWILDAPTPDAMAQRFTSTGVDHHHAVSLLSVVLRPNVSFADPASLDALLRYMVRWYGRGERPAGNGVSPMHLRVPVSRLTAHSCRAWPELLPALGHFLAEHITYFVPATVKPEAVDRHRTRALNHYLQVLAESPDRRGRQYAELVWEAQRTLLAMTSAALPRPLAIHANSFLAIRLVMLGLGKTDAERDAALRWVKTWPPYKTDRDAVDEARAPEEDYTRAIRAGIMAQESGNAKKPVDRIVDVLAGMAPDGTPTIPQRANLQGMLRRHGTRATPQALWATMIRATRNAHEAWPLFQKRPAGVAECARDHRVYGEMFAKLTVPVANTDHYLPGDGRHVVELHIPNLSASEIERRAPASVEQLYQLMAEEGVRPEGHCLAVLLRSARSERNFFTYLDASTLDRDVVAWLKGGWATTDGVEEGVFHRLPFGVLQAYVALLCRLHSFADTPNVSFNAWRHIPDAIRLVSAYAEGARAHARSHVSTRPLWHLLLRRISAPSGIFIPSAGKRTGAGRTHSTTLSTYVQVLSEALGECPMDAEMFFHTARVVGHEMRRHIAAVPPPSPPPEDPDPWSAQPEEPENLDGWSVPPEDPDGWGVSPEPPDCGSAPPNVDKLLGVINEVREGLDDGRGEEGDVDISTLSERFESGEISHAQLISTMANFLAASHKKLLSTPTPLTADDGTEYPLPAARQALRGMDAHVYMQCLAYLFDYKSMLSLLERVTEVWEAEADLSSKSAFHLRRSVCTFRAFGEWVVPMDLWEPMKERLEAAGGWPDDGQVGAYLESMEMFGVFWELVREAGLDREERVCPPRYWD